jgi:hypothetical protein
MNTEEELMWALNDLREESFIWRDDPEWAQARQTWREASPPAA